MKTLSSRLVTLERIQLSYQLFTDVTCPCCAPAQTRSAREARVGTLGLGLEGSLLPTGRCRARGRRACRRAASGASRPPRSRTGTRCTGGRPSPAYPPCTGRCPAPESPPAPGPRPVHGRRRTLR
eukprot:5962705-Pyramimonas_sp.AAC.1